MAGDLRDLRSKLLEAKKTDASASKEAAKKEAPMREKLTLKKKPKIEPSAKALQKQPPAQKALSRPKKAGSSKERPQEKKTEKSLKGFAELRALRQKSMTEEKVSGAPVQKKTAEANVSAKKPEVKNGEVLRNIPPKLELQANLPVAERAEEIAEAIKNNQVVIVSGETGSGKTTQLPKIAMMVGRGQKGLIGHTQPRRIAATSIAKRISEEMGAELGTVAGYKIRFKDEIEPGASIKLMTDGILLAETQRDRLLKAYDTIIIDEAHERSLNIDFLLGYLREILPKRPDLKVIITSATIDSERFAKHFEEVNKKPVPVINVSGRLYPVQIRYRPVEDQEEEDDRTLMHGIVDACEELLSCGNGDILVFLPGEREIREAADALSKVAMKGVEILPLFSRLSIEEQDRIFKSSGRRRIVLSTNIAETSLTVPGIRYVVDTGVARVKRYSYRNKVEQLQVEPISQAAAQQRAGRCGRVANGICIRLYDEKDFEKRPEYTDPEILRSSLATVILRMKSLHLTDVSEFPFVQRPLPRAITDGYDLLIELNAVKSRGGDLTEVGRALARLPLDARLARMLQAAQEHQALAEVLIIASAISIQDPRERPLDAQDKAAAAHKKFADEKSDFLSLIKLWNWTEDAIANKESNRLLEQKLRQNYISVKRLREWRDVYRQLKEMVKDLGWRINTAPATYEQLHKALLTGLLGNIGMKDMEADYKTPPYTGARGIKFYPWPGSTLAKKGGKWIMACEIVETTRLFARTLANLEPEWIEKIGEHLIKKSWSDPHWEKKAGNVIAYEKGTLYGLPIYSERKVDFSRKDPKLARELFIRRALVEEELESRAPFWQHNVATINNIREMEHKSRRPDVLVDDSLIFDFYDKRIGEEVVNQFTFDKWREKAEADNPKLLFLQKTDLMRHDASGITIEYFPKKLEIAGVPMALNYNFDPGSPRDGVTLTVPLFALNQLDAERLEWLVPGMVKEKVQMLLKSLPQKLRRHFVPLPDWAKDFAQRHEIPQGDLIEQIIKEAREQFRIDINRQDFKFEMLAPHLSMNYKVVDEHGRQLAMSRSIPQLRSELSAEARKTFQNIASQDSKVAEDLQDEIVEWSFGELPDVMEIRRKGISLIGHPALVDKGSYCSLEVFDDLEQAQRLHRKGLVRLIRLALKEQIKFLDKNLKSLQTAQIQGASIAAIRKAFPSFEELKQDVIDSCIEAAAFTGDFPLNADEFSEVVLRVKEKLGLLTQEMARLLSAVLSEASAAQQKLNSVKIYREVSEDITSQLGELFQPHFLLKVPFEQLRHYPRYLKAIQVRIDRLRNDPGRDAERMASIQALQVNYKRELASRKGVYDGRLAEFGNMLQELRVSLFAQELRTPMPVSVKRLNKMWEAIQRENFTK